MSIGNGTGKLSSMVVDAVGKIGIPGMLAAALLYAGWRIGSELTASHVLFLKAAQERMEVHRQEDEKINLILTELAKNQRDLKDTQAEMVRNQGILLKLLGELKR